MWIVLIDRDKILFFLRNNKVRFAQDFKVVRIGVFGSFARNEATETSDIDLLVEFEPSTSNLSDKKAALKALVEKEFNRRVDVCREKYIKSYYRNNILNSVVYA